MWTELFEWYKIREITLYRAIALIYSNCSSMLCNHMSFLISHQNISKCVIFVLWNFVLLYYRRSTSFNLLCKLNASWAAATASVLLSSYSALSFGCGFMRLLQAKYTDPHTKLRYATPDEYQRLRSLPSDIVAGYLALRKANPAVPWRQLRANPAASWRQLRYTCLQYDLLL